MKKGRVTGATPVVKKQPFELRLPTIHSYWIVVPLLVVSLGGVGQWIYSIWPINNVEVRGQFSLWRPELIAEQLLWLKDESFFSADLHRVYQQIEDLPLLNVIRVQKQWPDGILLTVHEDVPMAIWNGEEVLTVTGNILPRPGFVRGDKLARMRGNTQFTDRAIQIYRRLHQMLQNTDIAVTVLEASDVGAVSVELSNNWSVELGRQYFEERIKRLEILLNTLPQEKVATIDLRYVKGAAIQWLPTEGMES